MGADDPRPGPIAIDGHRGYFTITGEGQPIVLLASQLVLIRSYRPTIEGLARWFRVFAVEMPGCGHGDGLARPWPVTAYARWLAGFLKVAVGEPVPVIGHSCSGAVALALGALYPERVERLVLADTIGADQTHSLPRLLLARALDTLIEWRLTLRAWPHVGYNFVAHTRNFLVQSEWAATSDLSPCAARVPVPTLLAWGRNDHTLPLRCAGVLQTLLPKATLYVSESGCHDWIIDHAAEFVAAVRAYVLRSDC